MSKNQGTTIAVLVALIFGLLLIVSAILAEEHHIFPLIFTDIIKEFGIVLSSVFGVSLFYERFIAERHFSTFHGDLQSLIGRGETNAAMCEALGILQIFKSRRDFEGRHSLPALMARLESNGRFRLFGRSLIFSVYGWQNFKSMLVRGATLELCMIDPKFQDEALTYLAGYMPGETEVALQRIVESIVPWLTQTQPKGTVEIRFHRFPLLDSLSQSIDGDEHRVVWDWNFGEGLEQRNLLYLDGNGVMGRALLQGRYEKLWDHAQPVFIFSKGELTLNIISEKR